MNEQITLFKALADASRLKIINRLMESPMYVELLAERLDLNPSTVSFHLKKLMDAGIVTKEKDQYYVLYSLKKDILDQTLMSLLSFESTETSEEDQREKAYADKVLKTFFSFNKLTTIPVQRKKRLIVLKKLAEAFEFNRTYTEREVNIIIADYHDDFATLRRELIIENLLIRDHGIYERVK